VQPSPVQPGGGVTPSNSEENFIKFLKKYKYELYSIVIILVVLLVIMTQF